jgi:serine/threonine protein kinase
VHTQQQFLFFKTKRKLSNHLFVVNILGISQDIPAVVMEVLPLSSLLELNLLCFQLLSDNLFQILHEKKVNILFFFFFSFFFVALTEVCPLQIGFDLLLGLRVAKQIVLGLSHLHQHQHLHLNLTSENILLDSSRNAKILLKIPKDAISQKAKKSTGLVEVCSSYPAIRPPEVTKSGNSEISDKTDIYCFGYLLWYSAFSRHCESRF